MRKQRKAVPIIVTALIVFITAVSVYYLYASNYKQTIKATSTLAQQIDEDASKDLKTLIHRAEKNVVQIEATSDWGENIGSGFLYNNKGDIITNAHVVKEMESIFVKTADAKTYQAAIVGVGEETDIAVIRVPELSNRTPVTIGTDTGADVGDEIIAVGSPHGFQNSVTVGIISGKNRTFEIDQYKYVNAYQISAPITEGNSGGPLIHKPTGKVIAINSAGSEEGAIGFSIPLADTIDQIKKWSEEADHEKLDYGTTGPEVSVNEQQMTEDARYLFGYFIDSIKVRDYITAYGLIGSKWQTDQSYTDFREMFVHTIDIQLTNMEITLNNQDKAILTANADILIRKPKHKVKETYDIRYTMEYENGQLKITDYKHTLTSNKKVKEKDESKAS
ncbi:S1C family serine protease [Pontibacillus litoralis]|uniref:Peptidase S1 n=1 Tax=Pontibacillus litoralis JSM 072002 TaxID=1385512 RepID=A0A0A5G729_9BACI|nr:trypsin-like peptidase domain-containing protein [Pontibacillus litoralis]KGX86905.1 hypothetical protein N784_03365 [Pontibacillus litoralis JSM 072002]